MVCLGFKCSIKCIYNKKLTLYPLLLKSSETLLVFASPDLYDKTERIIMDIIY